MIPLDDRGFTLGDGLFETILWEGEALRQWEAHYGRLARGCATLGLPPPNPAEALAAALAAGRGLGASRGAVRLTYTAGSGGRGLDRPDPVTPRLVASAAPAARPASPARLVTAATRRNDASPASRLKSLSYLDNVLARAEATAAGADEALMLNTRGEVACGAAANVFWLRDGAIWTPSLDCGVLEGIMRAQVLNGSTPVREVRASPDVLAGCDGIFLTNSLIGVRPVSHLDGVALPAARFENLL